MEELASMPDANDANGDGPDYGVAAMGQFREIVVACAAGGRL
jgi:hypothetical protein